ncbi:MAG TPA: hypothetical protein VJN22_00935 [Candidatus Eremiobacteraceae bacterium]|nr:hypothetical protein [Candidatus Eremiobacteraceae bacterium]
MNPSGPPIASGTFHACFIFDVADTIDLKQLTRIGGTSAQPAPLRLRATPSPGNIQFAVPPLAANLPRIEIAGQAGTSRAKIYDFGVISIRFSFPFAGPWEGFAELAASLRRDESLPVRASKLVNEVLADCAPALDDPHPPLVEDYFIYAVESFVEPTDATTLLGEHRAALVSLIMAETHPLGLEEQSEALRLHFSYYTGDLVVVLWDSAFVYENTEDAEVIEDILEFANSQLVEFRTYDARLDAELDAIYAMDVPNRTAQPLRRRAADVRAQELRYLMVDIRELADRASNALKVIGDAYYARIYRGIATRLGLDDWQHQIESKLDSVGEVYRYLIDQAQIARGEFLEIIVIVLIAIEIVVGILGLRH